MQGEYNEARFKLLSRSLSYTKNKLSKVIICQNLQLSKEINRSK